MSHRDQLKAPVEDAEHFILVEVERVDVAGDLRVGGGVAEAKVAIRLAEAGQVGHDAITVPWAEGADGHPGPFRRRVDFRGNTGWALL